MLNPEVIDKMAWVAGGYIAELPDGEAWLFSEGELERLVRAAYERGVADERAACATLCDWLNGEPRLTPAGCAAAIRARRTSTISPATLIDPRGSLGEPIV